MDNLNIEDILAVVGGVIALASAITAVTGTPSPDTKLGKLYKIIEILALVVNKAKDDGSKK